MPAFNKIKMCVGVTIYTLGEETLEIVMAFTALKIESNWARNPVTAKQFAHLLNKKENTIEISLNEIFH